METAIGKHEGLQDISAGNMFLSRADLHRIKHKELTNGAVWNFKTSAQKNYQQKKQAAYRIEENICQLYPRHGFNI